MITFMFTAILIIFASWLFKATFHFVVTVIFITITLISWNLHTPEGYVVGTVSGLISAILLINLLRD